VDWFWEFHEFEVPRFQDSRHMKVVKLSALDTGQLHPSGDIPVRDRFETMPIERPEGLCQ